MVTHLYYITKFLQLSAGVAFAVGTTMLVAPRIQGTGDMVTTQPSLERKIVRALPVKLPQGRLYCVQGVVMHERMHPRGFDPISSADAIEIATTIADEACNVSFRSSACKIAQADLTSLRRALRSCEG
jgi:hypothetical protein